MTASAAAADNNPQAGAGRPLPKKEADIFKNIVKHYEMKQYKKAVKQADAILKKFPNHGETLAMKGLTLNYMSKRDDAHALVKQGLMNDMRSHVCWHVYGLLHRSDHNYNEAIKAYKQALRIDAKNLQILRDLSMLQIQMRDLDGFAITRNTLLTLKPNAKINWMAFALARHLTGDLQGAVKVIDIYLGTLTEGSAELGRCFESSELAMYKNSILAEIPNNYKEALDHLGVCEGIVVDRGAWLQTRAEYQLKLKDYVAAKQSVMLMFQRGMTENYRAHSLYMCCLLELTFEACEEALNAKGTRTLATVVPLSDEQKETIRHAYQNELLPRFPWSHAVQRIPISLLSGEALLKELEARCRRELARGVPSLCSELMSFVLVEENGRYVKPTDPVDIKSEEVYKMVVGMVDKLLLSLSSTSKFSADDEKEEPPSTLLWAWYLRAGLHEVAGEYAEAIALTDKCLEHTPTAVDVYEMKARLLKAAGDIQSAVDCVDKGRDLDRQDRYINNLATKFMLQAGMEDEALKRIALFTRHEGNPEQNLYDMQCSWYELELAASLARKEEWGKSLKKYSAVVKHFDDFYEDQFDFHAYCLRKVTLRAYVSVLRFEDVVYGQDFFSIAAAGIIRIYLHLHDFPSKDETEEPDYSKMTAAERKKAKAIARKKKKAAEKKEAEKKEKEAENGSNKKHNQKGGKPSVVDQDPLGKELLKKDPLEEAKNYTAKLARYAPEHIETWILQYDVSIRRKKALMALQALHKARSIEPGNSELFTRIIDFSTKVDGFQDLSPAVSRVIADDAPPLLNNQCVSDFIQGTAKKASDDNLTSLPLRSAVAKALVEAKIGTVANAASIITTNGLSSRQVTVDTCREALVVLKSLGEESSEATKDWIASVKGRFPLLRDFA